MRGAIPTLPQYVFIAWCSVKKHRDNFAFTFEVVHVLNQVHRHEDVWGIEGIAPRIVNLGGGLSALRPDRFNPGERTPSIHFMGGWMSSRASLDVVADRS
jgi:hypothetical protein